MNNYNLMPRGRPKKVLSLEEQTKLDNRKRVRAFLLRIFSHLDSYKINWMIETAIAKKIAKQYGLDFLEQFNLPDFLSESNSLRPLTGEWGRKFLNQEWNRFLVFKEQEQNQNIQIEPREIIENPADSRVSKIKSLKEFLK